MSIYVFKASHLKTTKMQVLQVDVAIAILNNYMMITYV